MRRALMLLLLLPACDDLDDGDSYAPRCDSTRPGARWTGRLGSVLRMVATNPSPPAMHTNWWAVTIDDRDGAPMIDPEALVVSAVMPEDGRGAPAVPGVTYQPDGLVVGPLELSMPGHWEVRFDVEGDRIVIPICVDE